MDKGIRKLKKTLQLCLTASLVIIGNSCIDNKYNLDQDISLTVEVGSGLGFPLGSTEEKLLKDLISEKDVDGLIEGDEYSIQKSDVFNSTIEPQHVSIDGINQTVDFNIEFSDLVIDPITVEANHKEASLKSDNPIENVDLSPNAASDQSISVTHGSVPQVSDLPAIDIHPTGTNPFVLNINSVSCPEEITSVQKILFAKGNNAQIKIDVKRLKNDLKLSEINLQVIDFTVTFPAAFKLSGTTANGMQISGNKLIISGTTLTDDRIYAFNIDSYTLNSATLL